VNIDAMIEALVAREGGYSNNPADRGGPTNYGITEQVARAFGYRGDMRLMPRQVAEAIYKARYWLQPHFDQVADRYPKLAEELFDTGVNMGPKVAKEFLQRALNVLNRGAIDYPDIGVDGDIGNLTLHALDGFKAKRGAAGESVLLKAIECLQGCKYIAIAEARPANEAFVYGWLANRIGLS
jgi:lysozyme family protein